jgi:alpha-D-ribose 1-methylphosphonate 5-phosphate C-P lyase
LLPLGARGWYPRTACAYCGHRERLRPQVMVTYARALVCADTVACERRRYRKRQAA